MSDKIKILIVEHDSADLELMLRELKKSGLNFLYEVVQTELDYATALDNFVPDIILSDYSLPSFDGLAAFKIRQTKAAKTPFIFVSGTIGEEKSIELIKNGVTDYVLKDKIFTLITKINRALKESKEHADKIQAELLIAFEQNNLNALINNTNDLMWSVDKNFNLITSNQPFDKMSRVSFGKSISKGENVLSAAYSPEMYHHFKELYERAFTGEAFTKTEFFESPVELWVEISYYPIRKGNEIIGTACHSRDITNIKKIERKIIDNEKRFRALVESGADAVAILSADGKPFYVSPTIEKVLGYTEEEALQLDLFSLFHQDDVAWAVDVWQQVLANPGKPISVRPSRMMHKDGNWRWLEGTLTNLLNDEAINGIVDNFRDVTEKKNAEDLMLLTQFAIDNAGDAVFWMTADATITNVNNAACNMLGYTKAELLKLNIPNIDPFYNIEKWGIHFEELRQKGSLFFETAQQAKNGKLIPVEIRANYIKYNGIEFNCAFSRNITERKRAEEKLLKSEASLVEAQAIGHIGSWEVDLENYNHIWSDELYNIFGINKDEVQASTSLFLSLIHPNDATLAKENIDKAFDLDQPTSHNFRFIRKDGAKRYGYIERKFAYNENNKLIRAYGIIQDITERKVVEQQLKKSEAFNRGVIDSLNSHIAVLDATGNIVTINDAWKQFGLDNEGPILQRTGLGSNYFEVCDQSAKAGDTIAAQALQGIKDVMDEKITDFYLEYPCHSLDKQRWFAMRVVKFKSDIPMVIVAHQNITELKKAELERDITLEANEELEKIKKDLDNALKKEKDLSELKSRFVAMASHEFRTPLTTMLSSVALITKYVELADKKNQLKHINKVKKSINNLTDILNDFLSVSKLEEGKVQNVPEKLNLKNFIEDIVIEMELMVSENQKIVFQYAGNEVVYVDEKLLKNILFNLISNAIKFSKENGLIEVIASVLNSSISIIVKDYGIGIAENDQKHLFERFFRGYNAAHIQGTGLGLNIVAKYAEQMNGTVQFESEENKGTTFTIVIPQ